MRNSAALFSLLTTLTILTLTLFFTSIAKAEVPLKWSGDLRYRFSKTKESTDEDRLFQQLRARLGVKAEVQDDLTVTIRLATATSPISTNQTMGDPKEPGMARRNFGLDLAYGEWQFLEPGRVQLGRVPNPFWAPGKTQLIFDSDLAFEGGSATWRSKWSDSAAFANFGGFIISENYSAPNDALDTGIVGGQLGYMLTVAPIGQFTMHAARYHFVNIVERVITSVDKDAKVDPYSYPVDRVRGNSVYPNDPLAPPDSRKYYYKYDYVQTELGLEWKLKIGAVEPGFYFDWVQNDRTTTNNEAQEYGFSVRWGRAQVLWAYSEKKADSIVGVFSDSDMNGGGTDNRGTKISLSYQLSDNSSIAFTEYRAKRGIDSVEREYVGQQLDFNLGF